MICFKIFLWVNILNLGGFHGFGVVVIVFRKILPKVWSKF